MSFVFLNHAIYSLIVSEKIKFDDVAFDLIAKISQETPLDLTINIIIIIMLLL